MDDLDRALAELPRHDASEWSIQEILRQVHEEPSSEPMPGDEPAVARVVARRRVRGHDADGASDGACHDHGVRGLGATADQRSYDVAPPQALGAESPPANPERTIAAPVFDSVVVKAVFVGGADVYDHEPTGAGGPGPPTSEC